MVVPHYAVFAGGSSIAALVDDGLDQQIAFSLHGISALQEFITPLSLKFGFSIPGAFRCIVLPQYIPCSSYFPYSSSFSLTVQLFSRLIWPGLSCCAQRWRLIRFFTSARWCTSCIVSSFIRCQIFTRTHIVKWKDLILSQTNTLALMNPVNQIFWSFHDICWPHHPFVSAFEPQ